MTIVLCGIELCSMYIIIYKTWFDTYIILRFFYHIHITSHFLSLHKLQVIIVHFSYGSISTQPEISQACRKLLILPACGKLSTSRDRSVGFVRR